MSQSKPQSPAAIHRPNDEAPGDQAPIEVHFDPTPPLCQDVLELFRGPFAEVRFPDVDRARLEADARALLVCQAGVEALERKIERARQDTREAAALLSVTAGRALAYAKVFAMGQPHFEEALGMVRAGQADTSVERGTKKRRGRPASPLSEQLPIHASSAEAVADDMDDRDSSQDQAAE